MIIVYPLLAGMWLMLAVYLFYVPIQGLLGDWAPYGALMMAGYNLVRMMVTVRAALPRKVRHETPLPDKPVVAPEFDFEDHDGRPPR
jgi:hypothetical protein